MTLLVRDEIDVVGHMIDHHLAAGVDHVIATDNGSVDGTVEVLERYRDAGVLELLHEPAQDYEQGRWVTRMARRAATRHGADWVVNADADEFFWPLDLHAALAEVPAEYGRVEVQRDNLIADPAETGCWPRRLVIRDTESLSPRGTRIGPKTCHRADPDVTVEQGNHGVHGPLVGPVAPLRPLRPLRILHVPDRGYEQYRRKIANGGSAYAVNTRLGSEVGWHWREDHARLLNGELPAVYASRQRGVHQIEAGLAAGSLCRDHRLLHRLERLGMVVR